MNLGFTGTARGMTLAQRNAVYAAFEDLQTSKNVETVHHGMCIGADEEFEGIIREARGDRSIPEIVGHPGLRNGVPHKRSFSCKPDTQLGPREMMDRNQDIAEAGGELWATPHGFGEEIRSGTWATIRRARKLKRDVRIFWPNGSETYIEGGWRGSLGTIK